MHAYVSGQLIPSYQTFAVRAFLLNGWIGFCFLLWYASNCRFGWSVVWKPGGFVELREEPIFETRRSMIIHHPGVQHYCNLQNC